MARSPPSAVILATATYKGVETMESTEFCGQACHSVMAPEFTAYQRSPHANVKCVDCHIGPGAGWFVKSKLSGAWQVVSVAANLYPRPISTPVHSLRPARETCRPDSTRSGRRWTGATSSSIRPNRCWSGGSRSSRSTRGATAPRQRSSSDVDPKAVRAWASVWG
mgnify:CR=1 FL=1